MMNFLQTGKAVYVLAAICLAGIFTRLLSGSFYKRLIKETANMALTKNKTLKMIRQNAEDSYRLNQGISNTRIYIDRQMYTLTAGGVSLRGLDNLSGQLTLLCFLTGGAAAFFSYWYRSDNYYIVLYGTVGILGGMCTMLIDYGVNLDSRRQQLAACLLDYLENVMCPRMKRESEGIAEEKQEEDDRKEAKNLHALGRERRGLRRSLEQTAASRERARETPKAPEEEKPAENLLKDLSPEQKRMLGELLKEFIS